ncbi:hypothetical protein Ngar_c12150 [Candidatus Nitrososphaera gargensis Ga9.2]|uniref:Uncharacterized protein n=1 Tax=Nitrososphaera gargensis (strain Ga9.2) TaxID=1237085 RepID=K0IEF6_NITGG|nr:hypothetical protein [Candidatus Nitrososphaera gargensis]AFU58155.1 hypothetical protein Ngar_c12150 [Candidatus Nitrososphaera gargensis Ga9.2]
MLGGRRHLHIDPQDQPNDWLSKALKSASSGMLAIDFENRPVVRVTIDNGTLAVDLLQPDIFKTPQDEIGLFDKLKTATEFGRKLSDNDVTISFLRRGKEAVRLGKDAKPTLSKLITRSDDVQMTSVKEFAGLKSDLKTD